LLEDAGGGVEIVEGFEEGHDLECRLAARPSREEEHGQEIGRAPRHRDDEGPPGLPAVDALNAGDEAGRPPRLTARLPTRRRPPPPPRARAPAAPGRPVRGEGADASARLALRSPRRTPGRRGSRRGP